MITNSNVRGLSHLAEEFRFGELTAKLSEVGRSWDFKEESVRLSGLEWWMHQRDRRISELLSRMAPLEAELSVLRSGKVKNAARIEDAENGVRVLALEEHVQQRDMEVEALKRELWRQSRL